MPRLTLVRHAHASDAPPGGEDFDRPLSAEGASVARSLRAQLRDLPRPHRLRVSPSLRTLATAQYGCLAAWPGLTPDPVDTLYLASLARLLGEIRATPPACEHLLIVGHNPGLSELWSLLGGEPGFGGLAPGEWRSRVFDASWAEVAASA